MRAENVVPDENLLLSLLGLCIGRNDAQKMDYLSKEIIALGIPLDKATYKILFVFISIPITLKSSRTYCMT